MAYVPVPNGAEFVVRGFVEGQQVNNTFYATHAAGWDVTELISAAAAISDVWVASILPHLGSSYTFAGVHGRDLRSSVGVECDFTAGAGAGTASGTTLPNNVALAVARRSGLAGRSARGRVYIGGLTDASLTGTNEVNTGVANALRVGLDAIRDAIQDVDWTEVIVSRVHDGVPLSTAVVYTVIEYIVVDLVLDSMRRRLPKRGV